MPASRQSAGKGASAAEGTAPFAPHGSRHLAHAAEQPAVGARPQQHGAIGAHGDERRAAPGRPLRLLAAYRIFLLPPLGARYAALSQRAERARRLLRRAERGAEIHHGLRIVAGAQCRRQPRLVLAHDHSWRLAAALQWRTAARSPARCWHRPPAAGTSNAIAAIAAAVYSPMPGSVPQPLDRVGKPPAVPARHSFCAGLQVARPRIVAEPRPRLQHIVPRRRRERPDRRPGAP